MKAVAVFPSSKDVKLIEHPTPELKTSTDVLVRMLEVGVCGTDREIVSFQYGTPPRGEDHLVIGHESLAEVVDTGPAVTRVKKGDLVVVMVRRPCPHPDCRACAAHRPDFCFTGDFKERGINQIHGFMTSLVVDDEAYMNVVPKELRDVGVLVEPLTIAQKALAQVWAIQSRLPWTLTKESGEGLNAVVLGAGPVGLLGAMTLLHRGFQTFVYSREPKSDPKAAFVQAVGATYVCSSDVSLDALKKKVGRIDLVYEATGASKLAFHMIAHLGTNGAFVFTGVPGRKGPIEIDTDRLMRDIVLENQVVVGSVNAGRGSYEEAIDSLADFVRLWPNEVASLITRRLPLEAFSKLLLKPPEGIKQVLVVPS